MTSLGRNSVRLIALTLVVGTFFTAQEIAVDLVRRHPELVGQDALSGLEFWVVWALLAPAVQLAVRRWPLDAKPVYRSVLPHVIVSIALAALHNLITLGVQALTLSLREGLRFEAALVASGSAVAFVWGAFTGVVFYAVIVMVYTVLRFQGLYVAEQIGAAKLESELTRSKLEALRSQLRPHFLFNTLNAISVIIAEDSAKAQQMILRLSTLLRRSLDEEAHEVPLQQELVFVNDYLDIQRARFGDRLRVNVDIDPEVNDAFVPVLLLQPLLENAIEHGRSDGTCTSVVLRASRVDDLLFVTLTDDGPGLRDGDVTREGVGLGNTRVRLRRRYGARASVQLIAANGGGESAGVCVDIRLPYRDSLP